MFGGCTAHAGGFPEPKALYLCLDGSGCSVLLGTHGVLWSLAPLCLPLVPERELSLSPIYTSTQTCMYGAIGRAHTHVFILMLVSLIYSLEFLR